MNNIPQVKIGIVAVSRDCFPESLSVNRRKALVDAYTKKYGKDYTALVMKGIDNKELGFGNSQGEKTVKLLIRTNKGYRIILHKMGFEDSESYILKKEAVRIRYLNGKYMIAGI